MLTSPMRIVTILVIIALSFLLTTCSDNPTTTPVDLNRTDISLIRTSWHLASKPLLVSPDSKRCKILWHSVIGSNSDTTGGRWIFRMVFKRAVATTYPKVTSLLSADVTSYAAICSYAGQTLGDKFQYLGVKVRGTVPVLHLDYGWFNQDVDSNGSNNAEHLNSHGILEDSADVGLDGYADADEPGYDLQTNPDPDGDDFYFQDNGKCPLPGHICDTGSLPNRFSDPHDPLFYEYLNGTEGNIKDLGALGVPDQEMITPTWFTTFNLYYSYSIGLSSDSFLVEGPDAAGWRTYHIPLRDSLAISQIVSDIPGTDLDPTAFKMIRLWVDFPPGQTVEDTVEITDLFLYSKIQ